MNPYRSRLSLIRTPPPVPDERSADPNHDPHRTKEQMQPAHITQNALEQGHDPKHEHQRTETHESQWRHGFHTAQPTPDPGHPGHGSAPALIPPVGAVITETGLTFSIAPANPLTVPLRLRCTFCSWQATVTGAHEIRQQSDRHAVAHGLDPDPLIPHLPSWLQWRKGTA